MMQPSLVWGLFLSAFNMVTGSVSEISASMTIRSGLYSVAISIPTEP